MRVLVCSFGSPGFLFPLIGLANALRENGHEVFVATGQDGARCVADCGFDRVPRGASDGDSFNVQTWYHPVAGAIDVKHALFAARRVSPDVILTHQLCLSGIVAAELLGRRVGVMGSFTYLYSAVGEVEATVHSDRRAWREREMVGHYTAVRRACGLSAVNAADGEPPFLGDAFMMRTVATLEPDLDRYPTQVHLVGDCTWEPATADSAEHRDEAVEAMLAERRRPLVYVQNGRTFGGPTFWPRLVEALAQTDVDVLASVGRMDESVGTLPPNFVARPHVPQGRALERASLAITAGHSAVIVGAAASGVPCLLMPFGVETPDNALRMQEAGCASVLDIQTATADDLRTATLCAIRDDAMRKRCSEVRSAFAAQRPFARARSITEQLMAVGNRVTRAMIA